MALGAAAGGIKLAAKKLAKKKAAKKATPKAKATAAKQAKALERIEGHEASKVFTPRTKRGKEVAARQQNPQKSPEKLAASIRRGADKFQADVKAAVRSSDRRLAGQAAGVTGTAAAAGAAGTAAERRKAKRTDPKANTSRVNKQRDR